VDLPHRGHRRHPEDVVQAQAAAREGADIVAVIRSTGQSLLDHVPEGETYEGYAGTLRHPGETSAFMRTALDEGHRSWGATSA